MQQPDQRMIDDIVTMGGAQEPADVVEVLRRIIDEEGSLPAERLLADRLNVKRHQLRKVLQILRQRGELQPTRSGRRLPSPATNRSDRLVQSTNPMEVMEMRMMIEPVLARLAALRASPAEISRILQQAKSHPGMSPSQADQLFHRAIAAGSRNSLAGELHILLYQVQNDSRLRFADSDDETTADRIKARDSEHQMIADAIAARDPNRAERAMWEHLAVVQRKMASRFGVVV
ncbi:FadR family transcriptional regulator [Rhizobium sp. CG5]|uniref:FadR/GntR family transcriptional regulator n=1 Tax=Rhizobium sp. CG5 TaxID=2726076 RepID=UPI00203494B6|nr:FCD domain-containing protein [Rhizobium sp. CG5]MCM2472441.1 FadR family transcriptional regulator [Rhizobium sp. CG5]